MAKRSRQGYAVVWSERVSDNCWRLGHILVSWLLYRALVVWLQVVVQFGQEVTAEARQLLKKLASEELARRYFNAASRSTAAAAKWRNLKLRPVAWQQELSSVCDGLVRSTIEGGGQRLLISAPPRHGKTEIVGRAMPIHAMLASGETPMTFLYATASEDRAEEVSWQVRSAVERLFQQTGDKRFAPGRKWSTTAWETEAGHAWTGIGWSGATGGIGCRMLIMDDMIGTSETYRSKSKRDRIWRVVQEDLLSRIMDGGTALHNETRRGKADTTARLSEAFPGTWGSVVWRCYDPERGYLWPEVYGEEWRETMPHLTDSSSIWRSLYQQEPISEGGTFIQPEWLASRTKAHITPDMARKLFDRIVGGVDLTATGKQTSDPAGFVVVGVKGAERTALEVVNRRCGYVEQKEILKALATKWGVDTWVVERAAGGDAMISDLEKVVRGIRGESPRGDKVARLTPHLGRIAAKQVIINEGCAWSGDFVDELVSFSGTPGELDNQVDAFVWALVAADTVVEKRATATQASSAVRNIWK